MKANDMAMLLDDDQNIDINGYTYQEVKQLISRLEKIKEQMFVEQIDYIDFEV